MSTLEELDDIDRQDRDEKDKKDKNDKNGKDGGRGTGAAADGDAEMQDAEPEEDDVLDEEILSLSTQDILTRRRLLENDSRIMKSEFQRLSHEKATMGEKIKENLEKIANNRYPSPHFPVSWLDCGANMPRAGNSPTWSETSSSCSISTPRRSRQKRVPISISMPPA